MKTHFEYFRGCRGREEGRGERHGEGRHCGGHGEFGGGRHGYGFRGGRGGPMRFFGAGDLRYVILQLIFEEPSHGDEIIKSIQEQLGGMYAPSLGVVFPMLTMLEEMGHATVVTEGTRKLYTITEEGSKALAENKAQVDGLFARR